jgi:hypothetical protein
MAQELSIIRRKGTSAIRVLIEATLPGADLRQKSRWMRALECLASEDVPAREFKDFSEPMVGWPGARVAERWRRLRRSLKASMRACPALAGAKYWHRNTIEAAFF